MEVIFRGQLPSAEISPESPPSSSERAGEQPAPGITEEHEESDPAQDTTNDDEGQTNPITAESQPQEELDTSETPQSIPGDDAAPLRRSARLQGKPPSLSHEMLADITKSHLLFMQMVSNPLQEN